MIATLVLPSENCNGGYLALILTFRYVITLQTSTNNMHTITFTAGLNTIQVHHVNRVIDYPISTYTQINVIQVQPDCTFHTDYTQLLHEKATKCLNEYAKRIGDSFETVVCK